MNELLNTYIEDIKLFAKSNLQFYRLLITHFEAPNKLMLALALNYNDVNYNHFINNEPSMDLAHVKKLHKELREDMNQLSDIISNIRID